LIPESFVTDLNVRLALYRRLSEIEDDAAIESFAAELIDRFGPLPTEVHTLLKIVSIKRMCRVARVEKIDAGPKGAVIAFRKNEFPKPEKLIGWLAAHPSLAKVRPDQKLSFSRTWATPEERLAGVHQIMSKLAELAG
jgi:transcription-repair coupling factor (superfamily II helicase)